MIQQILYARRLLACFLSATTEMALYFSTPFSEDNIFLRVMAIRSATGFLFSKYSYTLFLDTTPYIAYSILLSGIYIFALEAGRKIRQANCFFILTPGKGTFSRGGQGTPRPESNTLENAALAGHPGTRAFSRA